MHSRQAVVLGVLFALAYIAILALPLIAVVSVSSLSPAITIDVYVAGLIVDVLIGSGMFAISLRYALRASRGELFSIPVVTPVVDSWFRVQRP